MAKEISSWLEDLEFKDLGVPSWRSFKPKQAIKDGIQYIKDEGIIYIQTDQGLFCTECNTEVLGVVVAHPIHDGLSGNAGSGQVYNETVPYCPSCEEMPSLNGDAINHKNYPKFIDNLYR